MSCPALVITNLSVDQPARNRRIIDNFSLTVPGGGAVALIGERGSGKTMCSLAVMVVLPPGLVRSEGTVSIVEQPVEKLNPEQYRQLRNTKAAMVLQNPMSAFDPVLSIFSQFRETLLSHGSECSGLIRASASEALREVGFPEPSKILGLYPFQMSRGMLQRVMLALALISSPPLIIADEITTDLDLSLQARLLKILKNHCRRRHLALLLITHDLSVAAEMADEIVVMKEGRLMEKASTQDFFKSPQTDYSAALLAAHRSLYTSQYEMIMAQLK